MSFLPLVLSDIAAQDMRRAGCSLAEIPRAGRWGSAAFMAYLASIELDQVEMHLHALLERFLCEMTFVRHCPHSGQQRR